MKITVPEGIAKVSAVFCGCGRPQDAWKTVHDYLERFGRCDLRKPELNTGEAYITAYLLSHLGLIEHGGSVGGSWTTPLGVGAAAFLREHGSEWQDKEGVAFVTPYDGHDMFIGGDMGAM